MFSVPQQRFVVWLLLAGSAFVGSAARAAAPSTQPVPSNSSVLSDSGLNEVIFSTPSVDADPAGQSSLPISIDQPTTQPQAVNDPLPPALLPGLVMLALASALLSVRKLRRHLR